MAKFYFVRHGQSTANATGIIAGSSDPRLSDLGREQANITGVQLKSYNISVILSSPYTRAKQTADIIAEQIGIKTVNVIDELRERGLGDTEDKPKDMPGEWYVDNDADRWFETHNELFARMEKLFEIIKKYTPDQRNVLLVGHDVCGYFLRQYIAGKRSFAECDKPKEVKNDEIV